MQPLEVSSTDYHRKWREENPEKVAASKKRYAENHKDDIAAYQKAYGKGRPKRHRCSTTKAAYDKVYRQANREKIRSRAKRYRADTAENVRTVNKAWRIKNADVLSKRQSDMYRSNPESFAARAKRWKERNKAVVCEMSARRRAVKLQATPAWADTELIGMVYAEAARRRLTVDHIIPLQGKKVCGLHVHYNMQLLTKSQNSAKGNRTPKAHPNG